VYVELRLDLAPGTSLPTVCVSSRQPTDTSVAPLRSAWCRGVVALGIACWGPILLGVLSGHERESFLLIAFLLAIWRGSPPPAPPHFISLDQADVNVQEGVFRTFGLIVPC